MESENLATEVVIGQMRCLAFRILQVRGHSTANQYCRTANDPSSQHDLRVGKKLSKSVSFQEDIGLVSTGVSNDDANSSFARRCDPT